MNKIKLIFSGDIMLPNELINIYKTYNDYNFDTMFEEVKDFLNDSDYVVGNLETPISDNYEDIKHKQFCFTSPIEFAKSVRDSGFDFVTTANNHCLDNGIRGVEKTIDILDRVGLKHTGIFYKNKHSRVEIIDVKGIKIAFLSYTYGTNAIFNGVYLSDKEKNTKVNLLQEQELKRVKILQFIYSKQNVIARVIKRILNKFFPPYERNEKCKKQREELLKDVNQAKELGSDYIVMCVHEGSQYKEKPIKRAIRNNEFIQDCGVDLVVGNHEHRIQKAVYRNNKLITYCLGNFLGTAGVLTEPYNTMSNYSVLLNVYLQKDENVEVVKNTFTILKIVEDTVNGKKTIKTRLLYNLIKESKNNEEKNKLMQDNQRIVKIFTNKNIDINDIKKEYLI